MLFINPHQGIPGLVILPDAGFRRAKAEIAGWPGYGETELHALPGMAETAGVAHIWLKDEASRFGLASFKALGGAYAVLQVLRHHLSRAGVVANARAADLEAGLYPQAAGLTVTSATDGNHGRSVAWGAQRFGCGCVIFVHETVSQSRCDAIAAYGAEIRRVPGNYDDSVRAASEAAAAEGFVVVSDTSWPGYVHVPVDVMQGYRVMADEALQRCEPTHVFIQGGVGGVAAAVSVQMRSAGSRARLVVVEPDRAACLLKSAQTGALAVVEGALDTLMAGLACGEPSLLAWEELSRATAAFMDITDAQAVQAMRDLAALGIVSGESGAAGLAGLMAVAADPEARRAIGLDAQSRVLVFSTEGATDPALYQSLVG
jgi:diaminopropionate ammonia-lyase